jgi:NAD(P)-dependent dehydrogenase (short-subunit alcohol dehydrogenase family)
MMLERFSLQNKVILLTGGAGLYGRGLASDLAAAKATLIVASRNLESCQKVAGEESAQGHQVVAESFDQGDEASINALRERVLERFGRLDGLVNNSVGRPMGNSSDPTAGWEESLRVNATGVYLMHRIFGEALADGGSIVNIGSIYGMVGPTLYFYEGNKLPSHPDYFFHKSGMVNLTRFYAAQLGSRGIRVNCLSPGGFLAGQPENFLQHYCRNTFLGRMADKSDLGGAVVFLLSDASVYITGTNLPVDGGFTAH